MTRQRHRTIELSRSAPPMAGGAVSLRTQGAALNSLGNRYAARGEPHRAIACYQQALRIARQSGDREGEGVTLGNLGNRYAALGEARRAVTFYEQALQIARETGDGEGVGEALGGLSQAFTALREPRRAIELYDQALGIAREIGGRQSGARRGANLRTRTMRRGRPFRRGQISRRAVATWRQHPRTLAAAAMVILAAGAAPMTGLIGGGPESHQEAGSQVPEPPVQLASVPARESSSAVLPSAPAPAPFTAHPSEQRQDDKAVQPSPIVTAALPDHAAEEIGLAPSPGGDRAAARVFPARVQADSPAERVPPTSPTAPVRDPAILSVARWAGESQDQFADSGFTDAVSDFPTSRPGDGAADRQTRPSDRGIRSAATTRSARVSPTVVQANRNQLIRSGLLYGTNDAFPRQTKQSARASGSRRFVPLNQLAALGTSDASPETDAATRGVLSAESQDQGPPPGGQGAKIDTEDDSRLSDEPSPFLGEGDIPDRAPLLLEIGDPFLDTGELDQGFELPTGAVWQPRLWVFGTQRSSVQTIDTGDEDRISEWVNRLDLFGNLQLTGTEKIVAGIRPWDENQPNDFSGYRFEPENGKGFRDNLNVDIRTLFAEGDFGSLFPALDAEGQAPLDFGFTVGRQPIIFQDGILISDTQDTVGLVRNNIRLPGVSNLRVAGIYSSDLFDETTRSAGGIPAVDNENLELTGLFTEWDTRYTTINADAIYAWDDTPDGDGFYAGISAAQRIGELNTTFRVNGSLAEDDETLLVRDGILVSSELSWTPYGTNDTAYFNPFVAFGEFLQAAREEVDGGGPLAPLGILFASPNIGEFGSELSNRANDVVGAAIGYQAFWDDNRRNLAVEVAARHDLGLDDGSQIVTPEGLIISFDGFDQYGAGFQFQQAIGQRAIIQLEGFGALQEDRNDTYGGRLEVLYQF